MVLVIKRALVKKKSQTDENIVVARSPLKFGGKKGGKIGKVPHGAAKGENDLNRACLERGDGNDKTRPQW